MQPPHRGIRSGCRQSCRPSSRSRRSLGRLWTSARLAVDRLPCLPAGTPGGGDGSPDGEGEQAELEQPSEGNLRMNTAWWSSQNQPPEGARCHVIRVPAQPLSQHPRAETGGRDGENIPAYSFLIPFVCSVLHRI